MTLNQHNFTVCSRKFLPTRTGCKSVHNFIVSFRSFLKIHSSEQQVANLDKKLPSQALRSWTDHSTGQMPFLFFFCKCPFLSKRGHIWLQVPHLAVSSSPKLLYHVLCPIPVRSPHRKGELKLLQPRLQKPYKNHPWLPLSHYRDYVTTVFSLKSVRNLVLDE